MDDVTRKPYDGHVALTPYEHSTFPFLDPYRDFLTNGTPEGPMPSSGSPVERLDQYTYFGVHPQSNELHHPAYSNSGQSVITAKRRSPFADDGEFEDDDQKPQSYCGCDRISSTSESRLWFGTNLLGLCSSSTPALTVDQYGSPVSVSIDAQLEGIFFLADPSTRPLPGATPMPVLTCYRRNLFQISGTLSVPCSLHSVQTRPTEYSRIVSYQLQLSATETLEENHVRLLTIPPKAMAGPDNPPITPPLLPLPLPDDPSLLSLDQENRDEDPNTRTLHFDLPRLQFRAATSNNGRRASLQQYFTLHLALAGKLSNGEEVNLAETHSRSLVVRGRSPRNFQNKGDVLLSTGGAIRHSCMNCGNRRQSSETNESTGDGLSQSYRDLNSLEEHLHSSSYSQAHSNRRQSQKRRLSGQPSIQLPYQNKPGMIPSPSTSAVRGKSQDEQAKSPSQSWPGPQLDVFGQFFLNYDQGNNVGNLGGEPNTNQNVPHTSANYHMAYHSMIESDFGEQSRMIREEDSYHR